MAIDEPRGNEPPGPFDFPSARRDVQIRSEGFDLAVADEQIGVLELASSGCQDRRVANHGGLGRQRRIGRMPCAVRRPLPQVRKTILRSRCARRSDDHHHHQ